MFAFEELTGQKHYQIAIPGESPKSRALALHPGPTSGQEFVSTTRRFEPLCQFHRGHFGALGLGLGIDRIDRVRSAPASFLEDYLQDGSRLLVRRRFGTPQPVGEEESENAPAPLGLALTPFLVLRKACTGPSGNW